MRYHVAGLGLLLLVAGLVSCTAPVPEVAWDRDSCDYCRMTVSDRRFGAAAISAKGRTLHFDSIECLAAWVDAQPSPPRGVWMVDASAPGALLAVAALRFHRTAVGTSPMGKGFVAVARSAGKTPWDGPVLSWDEVREAVAREGMASVNVSATTHRH